MNESTEITEITQVVGSVTSLAPRNMAEAMEFAKLVSQSDVVPKDFKGKPANVLVAVQWGMELGLAPMQAMQNIAVINGRPSIWGDAMLAICQAHPAFEGINETVTDEGCTVEVRRNGKPAVVRTFTMEDAQKAGLAGKQGPWTQYPKRMMQMRARSFALRDAFADALKGIQSAEEVGDMVQVDMGDAVVVNQTEQSTRTDSVKDKVRKKRAPKKKPEPETVDTETGEVVSGWSFDGLTRAFGNCKNADRFDELQDVARSLYGEMTAEQKLAITKTVKQCADGLGLVEKPE